MSALELIYDKLLEGESFGKIEKHNAGGTYFWNVLSSDKVYIYWRHYGSSANKISLTSLRWILRTIFNTTAEQFLYDYTTYSQYKMIDDCYKLC